MRAIEVTDVFKTYRTRSGSVEALKGVSLHVEKGDIFGVIGHSGSGKSTLIRCINRLEKFDRGSIFVGGSDLMSLSEKELRQKRQKIGMIFQQFHLLRNDSVYGNVLLPLTYAGSGKAAAAEKADRLLTRVGLREKRGAYPSQLSGGQQQRVAIARALANDPEILLCDEATSALDPDTTHSILALLKELNQELQLTVLIITHEMAVVKDICSNVAVLDGGKIVEQGKTLEMFTNPRHSVTKQFANSLFEQDKIKEVLLGEYVKKVIGSGGLVARLIFKGEKANDALISDVSRRFGIDASIIFGNIEIIQSQPLGNLYVAFSGPADRIAEAVDYAAAQGVLVQRVAENAERR
ncbi:MAG: ATP-binding cassette domain-containing protein [Synergistaceae bacterium]|jgi:D-methionine transport system ATP-binding protein|nr:ATP-binding cassette domain-containing protein [Synergistaceae bacterium]